MENQRRVAVLGVTGFIGTRLVPLLRHAGFEITGVSRQPRKIAGVSEWQKPATLDLSQHEVVICLSGEPVNQRWTEQKKSEFRSSRIDTVKKIVQHLSGLPAAQRPKTFLVASAVGIYGDRGDEELTECAQKGEGFLADLCEDWEQEARAAEAFGTRVIHVRIGVVLGKGGSAFELLKTVFRCGIGGNLGSGRQWMPWIHVSDLCRSMVFAIQKESFHGVFNAVSPRCMRNSDFTRAMAKATKRIVFLPVPRWALRLALGEFSSVLLASQHVIPSKLVNEGFVFHRAELSNALDDLLSD